MVIRRSKLLDQRANSLQSGMFGGFNDFEPGFQLV